MQVRRLFSIEVFWSYFAREMNIIICLHENAVRNNFRMIFTVIFIDSVTWNWWRKTWESNKFLYIRNLLIEDLRKEEFFQFSIQKRNKKKSLFQSVHMITISDWTSNEERRMKRKFILFNFIFCSIILLNSFRQSRIIIYSVVWREIIL